MWRGSRGAFKGEGEISIVRQLANTARQGGCQCASAGSLGQYVEYVPAIPASVLLGWRTDLKTKTALASPEWQVATHTHILLRIIILDRPPIENPIYGI